MNCFTRQERLVILFLVIIFVLGSVSQYAFKKYPFLADIVNVMGSEKLYAKVDVNKASLEEFIEVPYIGEYTARNIVFYRRANGPFVSIEQLKNVKGIRDKNFNIFKRYLEIKLDE